MPQCYGNCRCYSQVVFIITPVSPMFCTYKTKIKSIAPSIILFYLVIFSKRYVMTQNLVNHLWNYFRKIKYYVLKFSLFWEMKVGWLINIYKTLWNYEFMNISKFLWRKACIYTVEPPLSDLFYLGTSVVWTAQINYVVCSLLPVIKVLVKVQGGSLHSVVYFLGHLLQYISMWF